MSAKASSFVNPGGCQSRQFCQAGWVPDLSTRVSAKRMQICQPGWVLEWEAFVNLGGCQNRQFLSTRVGAKIGSFCQPEWVSK